jgi:hypothetical protein
MGIGQLAGSVTHLFAVAPKRTMVVGGLAAAIGTTIALTQSAARDAPPSQGSTGIRWNPDDTLPSTAPGGARQAAWAKETLTHYDADGDGTLTHEDGVRVQGAWSNGTATVDALIARYDTDGDDQLVSREAARIGSDVAGADGFITRSASDRLRESLR